MSAKCAKKRYRDRVAALLALANTQFKDSSSRAKIETRAYKCDACVGWHITSKKKRERVTRSSDG